MPQTCLTPGGLEKGSDPARNEGSIDPDIHRGNRITHSDASPLDAAAYKDSRRSISNTTEGSGTLIDPSTSGDRHKEWGSDSSETQATLDSGIPSKAGIFG